MPAGGYILPFGSFSGETCFEETSSLNAIFAFQILSYTGGQIHQYGDSSVSKRINFTGDPTLGDASMSVSNLRGSDTATYQCKVKKGPGVDMRKVTLMVLGEEEFLFTSLTCSFSQPCHSFK